MPVNAYHNATFDSTRHGGTGWVNQNAVMASVLADSGTTASYTADGYVATDPIQGATRQTVGLPSAARTATINTPKVYTYGAKGVVAVLNITAGATLSLTPKIQGYDPISNTWYDILTGTASTGVAQQTLSLGLGQTAAANVSASAVLPEAIRVVVTAGNGNSATYSVSFLWND